MTALELLPRQQTIECGSRGIDAEPIHTVVDRDLERNIERALLATGHRLFHTIAISVFDGVITLRGRVPSYYLKQLAQSIVLAIPATRGVRNELAVVDPG